MPTPHFTLLQDISVNRIHNLLQLAIQTSTIQADPHREKLTCSLASHNLIQHLHLIQSAGEGGGGTSGNPSSVPSDLFTSLGTQGLKGIEALTLDYEVII